MDAKQKRLLDYISNEIFIKEECDSDADDETRDEGINHDDEVDEDYLPPSEYDQSKRLKRPNDSATQKQKPLKKIAYGDQKKNLARIMKEYPFLWDKSHPLHRNRQKREEAWCRIANELNSSVLEVKTFWKKLKDTHRYLSSKSKKKIDFNSDDFCDDPDKGYNIVKDLSFLDNNYNIRVREINSSSRNPNVQTSTSSTNPLNLEDSNFDDNTSSQHSYIDASVEKRSRNAMEASNTVSQSTTPNFKKKRRQLTNTSDCDLKHMHIWLQLEKLFEKLDDDKITDLNFLFVSETYKAILDKRNNQ